MKYKINEIFHSIQGEGKNIGIPAIFIRLAGCSMKCSFCDTNYETRRIMTPKQIISQISNYNCNNIIITGGEPTEQDLFPLTEELSLFNYKIHLETNGSKKFGGFFNWITVSPKKNWALKVGDELKVVYTGQDLNQYLDSDFKYYYLQPCSMSNVEEVIEIIKISKIWRLSLQCQKLINIK